MSASDEGRVPNYCESALQGAAYQTPPMKVLSVLFIIKMPVQQRALLPISRTIDWLHSAGDIRQSSDPLRSLVLSLPNGMT